MNVYVLILLAVFVCWFGQIMAVAFTCLKARQMKGMWRNYWNPSYRVGLGHHIICALIWILPPLSIGRLIPFFAAILIACLLWEIQKKLKFGIGRDDFFVWRFITEHFELQT
jgi:hypothetical protein